MISCIAKTPTVIARGGSFVMFVRESPTLERVGISSWWVSKNGLWERRAVQHIVCYLNGLPVSSEIPALSGYLC